MLLENQKGLFLVEIKEDGIGIANGTDIRQVAKLCEDRDLLIVLFYNGSSAPSFELVEWHMSVIYVLASGSSSNVVVVPPLQPVYKNVVEWVKDTQKGDWKYHLFHSASQEHTEFIEELKKEQSNSALAQDTTCIRVAHENVPKWGHFLGQTSVVCVGGTFDHFHSGHKVLLGMCTYVTEQELVCGVTGEDLLKNKKFSEYLWSLDKRKEAARAFLSLINPKLNLNIFTLEDAFGPAPTDPKIGAIVVSSETYNGAVLINEKRKEIGLPIINVYTIRLMDTPPEFKKYGNLAKLSSTAYREAESTKHF